MRQVNIDMTPDKSLMKKIGAKNYKIGEALAELVDNSIDARLEDKKLEVNVTLRLDRKDKNFISVEDNGSGMDIKTLKKAIVLGSSNKKDKLGMYGMGLKTSCMNMGSLFDIKTTQINSPEESSFLFDSEEWMKAKHGWKNQKINIKYTNMVSHGTTILIKNLNIKRNIQPRRLENKIIEDFGIRYGMLIKEGKVVIKINNFEVEPNIPECESETQVKFDFLIDENNPKSRIHGWVGLKWDKISKKVVGSQRGNYGFITFRNKRLITLWDNMRVDNSIFAIKRHPTLATIIGVAHLDCIPVENDKRNFIQENDLYVSAVNKIREYVIQIERVIKSREKKSDMAEDIKEVTKIMAESAEEALKSEDIKNLIEQTAEDESIDKYNQVVKEFIPGSEKRGDTEEFGEKERRDKGTSKGTVHVTNPKKIREPKYKTQSGKVKNKIIEEDPNGILDLEYKGNKFKVKHSYVTYLSGDSLRAWSLLDDGSFLVKTNIGPFFEFTGKEYPVMALNNICESLAEYFLGTNNMEDIILLRDQLIVQSYRLLSLM